MPLALVSTPARFESLHGLRVARPASQRSAHPLPHRCGASGASGGDAGDAALDLLRQVKQISSKDLAHASIQEGPADASSSGGGCGSGCSSGSHLTNNEKEARMLTSGLIEKMNELLPVTLTREDMRAAFVAGRGRSASADGQPAGERFWTVAEVLAPSSADDPDAELDGLVV